MSSWEIMDESSELNNFIHILDPEASYNESESVCLIGNNDLSHAHALEIANLIAAAPDLLAVLEEWLEIAEAKGEYLGSTGTKARAAIAKARGGEVSK